LRNKVEDAQLTVNAVGGSYVVMLGMHLDPGDCDGLAGFAVERTDHTTGTGPHPMLGNKAFAATADTGREQSGYSTRHHPIQAFAWSDYSADPGHEYTYRVTALKGPPDDLQEFAEATLDVTTETPEGGDHDIYFNRGVAASQAYARRFQNRPPDEVGPEAFTWLSRGLAEAIAGFIARAADGGWGLRVAAYEFSDPHVLGALKAAVDRRADVAVVYDHRTETPGDGNAAAITAAGLDAVCTPRREGRSHISHNKFIVLTRDGKAQAVLTGGTNFSQGGIYGHSNQITIVDDPAVAADYLTYWELLHGDPRVAALARKLSETAIPDRPPPAGTTAIFSPRREADALDYYVRLARDAKDALFMTFAFGMNRLFQDVYDTADAPLRFATLETPIRPMPAGPERDAEEERIKQLRFKDENQFAVGAHLADEGLDGWVKERLSNLNGHVRYVHTKLMLVDPLSEDPIVVAGSANFSQASSTGNDENMLVIRGNKRIADIYLGEFMRIYRHHAFREFANSPRGRSTDLKDLRTDDWWKDYFGPGTRSRQRAYFAGVDFVP
jgi:hypothetical protein